MEREYGKIGDNTSLSKGITNLLKRIQQNYSIILTDRFTS